MTPRPGRLARWGVAAAALGACASGPGPAPSATPGPAPPACVERCAPAAEPPIPDDPLDAARRRRDAGEPGAEGILRRAFDALQRTGDLRAAASLVDRAADTLEGLSERLRFDAALAWRDAGEQRLARARLDDLAVNGRTIYAAFAATERDRLVDAPSPPSSGSAAGPTTP